MRKNVGRRGVEQQSKRVKEEWIHHSPYCSAENKQADGLIVFLRGVFHLGILIHPPSLIRRTKKCK